MKYTEMLCGETLHNLLKFVLKPFSVFNTNMYSYYSQKKKNPITNKD